MRLSWNEIRIRAAQFAQDWKDAGEPHESRHAALSPYLLRERRDTELLQRFFRHLRREAAYGCPLRGARPAVG